MGFLSGLFHSRDKPNSSTNDKAYRFLFCGSNSGKAVNERSAMQMTAVYACVRILSESIAGLSVHIYKYTDSDSKKRHSNILCLINNHICFFFVHKFTLSQSTPNTFLPFIYIGNLNRRPFNILPSFCSSS